MDKTSGLVLDVASQVGGSMPSTTTLTDRSRFKNNGAMTNVTWSQLPSKLWVMNYNGITGITTITDSASLRFAGNFSISAWIKVTDPTLAAEQRVIWKKTLPSGTTGWCVYLQLSKLYIGFGTGSGFQEKQKAYTSTAWTHIVCGYNGGTFHYYNGISQGGQATVGTPTAGTQNLLLGTGSTTYYGGLMSFPHFFSYALSPAQIRNLFNREVRLFR